MVVSPTVSKISNYNFACSVAEGRLLKLVHCYFALLVNQGKRLSTDPAEWRCFRKGNLLRVKLLSLTGSFPRLYPSGSEGIGHSWTQRMCCRVFCNAIPDLPELNSFATK
jgi:hypothetical protein